MAIAIGGALLIAALKRARMAPDDRPVDPYVVESPTPLMRLASVGDAGGVRALLQQSAHGDGDRSTQHEGGARAVGPGGPADVNAVFQQQSALHAALAGRHAQLSEAGRGGREAALRGEHERVVELLLSAPGAHAGPPVFCPVRDAVHYRAVREISTLLRAMPAPDVAACLQEVDYYGDTPLHVAARSKASGVARLFITRALRAERGEPLWTAADDATALRLLGVVSAKPGAAPVPEPAVLPSPPRGTSSAALPAATLSALGERHVAFRAATLTAALDDADVHAVVLHGVRAGLGERWLAARNVAGETAVQVACAAGRAAAAHSLIVRTAATAMAPIESVAASSGALGVTCGHAAAAAGHTGVLREWLATGGDQLVAARDAYGRTPLDVAVRARARGACAVLLEAAERVAGSVRLDHTAAAAAAAEAGDAPLARAIEAGELPGGRLAPLQSVLGPRADGSDPRDARAFEEAVERVAAALVPLAGGGGWAAVDGDNAKLVARALVGALGANGDALVQLLASGDGEDGGDGDSNGDTEGAGARSSRSAEATSVAASIWHRVAERPATLNQTDLVRDFLSVSQPVVVRGLVLDWSARRRWTRRRLLRDWGDVTVSTGVIPYADLYGMATRPERLRTFVERDMSREASAAAWAGAGGDAGGASSRRAVPAYAFDSRVLVQHAALAADAPTPPAFDFGLDASLRQFIAGPALTGAPAHFHGSAWNGLVFGAKLWVLLPPAVAAFSSRHPLLWLLDELPGLVEEAVRASASPGGARPPHGDATLHGACPLVTVQRAGDVVFVPAGWGHVVVNLADSVAVAVEFPAFAAREAGVEQRQ